jgi:hypothetical protein
MGQLEAQGFDPRAHLFQAGLGEGEPLVFASNLWLLISTFCTASASCYPQFKADSWGWGEGLAM